MMRTGREALMTFTFVVALLLQTAGQATSPPAAMEAYSQGQAAYEKQENAAALAAFDRAIALDARNADFHHARCRTLARLQRHAEGIESCSTALQLRPDNAPILIDRGHYYINVRKLDPALADLTRVAATKLEDYGLYYHLALALYVKGEFAKAADAYVGCVRTAQNAENRMSCQAWQYLALARAGRKDEAKALLDGFTPNPAATVNAYTDRLLLFKGVKTEEEVAAAMAKDGLQQATVGYGIGVWHLLNGREQQARGYFEKAIAPPAQLTGFGAVASFFELERMKR
jgi:tetratricopeptide (TPR) repeat protein